MSVIQAIQTRYNGFHFRSRIEARWAVFFDVLGIPYEYEPEKFGLPDARYIPDFRVQWSPGDEKLLEIKGAPPTDIEIDKARAIGAVIAHGNVNDFIFRPGNGEGECCEANPSSKLVICQCILCGRIELGCDIHRRVSHEGDEPCDRYIDSIADLLDIDNCFLDFTPRDSQWSRSCYADTPMLLLATQCARSARFESPEFMITVEDYRQSVLKLASSKTFGTSRQHISLFEFAAALSREPNCPRYYRREKAAVRV
jgi:hypothetical protein